MCRFFCTWAALILSATVATAMLPAAAPADDAVDTSEIPGAARLLPADTLVYLQLNNASEFRKSLAKSSIGNLLADPQLRPLASDAYQAFSELFEQVGAELGVSLDELLAIPGGQVAFAVMPANVPGQQFEEDETVARDESETAIRRRIALQRRQQNAFAGLLIVDASDNIAKLRTVVERLERRFKQQGYIRRDSRVEATNLVRLLPPRPGRSEIEYFERQQTIVLGIGHQSASKVLDQWLDRSDEPTLADRADFSFVLSRCIGAEATTPQITFFADPYHLVERLFKRGGAAAMLWPMVEELGIAKIRGVGGCLFRGNQVFERITHFHILIDPPRDGLFGVLRPKTGESLPPTWMPADVSSYTSIHWDFEKTYDNLGAVLEMFQGPEPLQRLIEDPMQKSLGISVRDDIVQNLTGRYVSGRWIEPPVKLNSQTQVHAFAVSDSANVKKTVAKIRKHQPGGLKETTIGGSVVYFPRRDGVPADENMRQPEPCFTLLGNWLIFSDSRKFMERAALTHRASLPRLLNVPEYELISSELGVKLEGEKPFLVSFVRGSEYVRYLYDLLQSDDTQRFLQTQGEVNPIADKLAAMLRKNKLPSFEQFEKYFAPGGTFAYDEPSGMHLGSFTLRADE